MTEYTGSYHCSCGYTTKNDAAMDRHIDKHHDSAVEDAIAAELRYNQARDELR
jgi:hypothetical protein